MIIFPLYENNMIVLLFQKDELFPYKHELAHENIFSKVSLAYY